MKAALECLNTLAYYFTRENLIVRNKNLNELRRMSPESKEEAHQLEKNTHRALS